MHYNDIMEWKIYFSNKATKQVKKLHNDELLTVVRTLAECLKTSGPFPGKEWPNYGKLKGRNKDCRHCHLMRGNPTYVCCWEVIDKKQKII